MTIASKVYVVQYTGALKIVAIGSHRVDDGKSGPVNGLRDIADCDERQPAYRQQRPQLAVAGVHQLPLPVQSSHLKETEYGVTYSVSDELWPI